MAQVTAELDDGLATLTRDFINLVAPATSKAFNQTATDLLNSVKGSVPTGPSIKTSWKLVNNKRVYFREPTGTRTENEWPVKTGRSRDGWFYEVRMASMDVIELVIKNKHTYAYMVKGLHNFRGQRTFMPLLRTPLRRQGVKLAEQLADELAKKI